jgi:[acyl-carrier-protein] S-malonyltransferase
MTDFAVVCPGQGAQHAGMFAFAQAHEAGRAVLEVFSDALHEDVAAIAADSNRLAHNRDAQVTLVAAACANWAVLQTALPAPSLMAGYSTGELAAWSCAGAWDVPAAAQAVIARAGFMDAAASEGACMMAVQGPAVDGLLALCGEANVYIAIVNDTDHAVLAGLRSAVERAQQKLEALGAWTKLLDVRVPSHTPMLVTAATAFGQWLAEHPARRPKCAVLAGVTGQKSREPVAGMALLARAISEPVNWAACMTGLAEAGTRVVLEIGPGRALTHLVSARHPALQVRSVDDFRSIDGIAQWIESRLAY